MSSISQVQQGSCVTVKTLKFSLGLCAFCDLLILLSLCYFGPPEFLDILSYCLLHVKIWLQEIRHSFLILKYPFPLSLSRFWLQDWQKLSLSALNTMKQILKYKPSTKWDSSEMPQLSSVIRGLFFVPPVIAFAVSLAPCSYGKMDTCNILSLSISPFTSNNHYHRLVELHPRLLGQINAQIQMEHFLSWLLLFLRSIAIQRHLERKSSQHSYTPPNACHSWS